MHEIFNNSFFHHVLINQIESILRGGLFRSSCKIAQASFRRKFQCRQKCFMLHQTAEFLTKFKSLESKGMCKILIQKDLRDPYSGRTVSAGTQRNIDAEQNSVGWSLEKSLRRRSQLLGISRESFRCVIKEDLHLYPYQVQIKQKLTEANMEKRGSDFATLSQPILTSWTIFGSLTKCSSALRTCKQ